MYLSAMRTASIATSKQSAGDAAAITGSGDSLLRPNITCSRSACSVLVGSPVDGPPRWMSQMTSGSSTDHRQAIASVLSAMPGPLGRGDAERAAERGADRRADRRDLVLGLEGGDAEVLVASRARAGRRRPA